MTGIHVGDMVTHGMYGRGIRLHPYIGERNGMPEYDPYTNLEMPETTVMQVVAVGDPVRVEYTTYKWKADAACEIMVGGQRWGRYCTTPWLGIVQYAELDEVGKAAADESEVK